MRFLLLNSVGLVFDGVGVVILGFAFFTRSVKAMAVESGTFYDGNDALIKSLIESRTDGIAGTLVLLLGFVLQLLSAIGVECVVAAKVLLVSLVGLMLIYCFLIRSRLVNKQLQAGKKMR